MSFGWRVRQLRKAKDLTLRDEASKVGINFTYLSKIEIGTNKAQPPFRCLSIVARWLRHSSRRQLHTNPLY